jgi:CheY-like chemotaxis protein
MLGGNIQVFCSPNVGCTFRTTVATGSLAGVPMRTAGETTLKMDALEPGAPLPKVSLDHRLLVAEDNPVNRLLAQRILERAGAQVEMVENGRDAVDRILAASEAGQPFDVLLLDMQMPVLDGYGAARELRARGYTGAIVALTANAMAEDRSLCMASGCDDFLTKPLDRAKLLETIVRMGGRKRIES